MREVYGTYEFSGDEVSKILYEELIRQGKKFPDAVGIHVNFNASRFKMNFATVKITDPIPGAKEL